jgi:putative addiction module killer protein
MIRVDQSEEFRRWRGKLRDNRAKARIATALIRLELGLGDIKRLSARVSEVRIDHGPGYRLYFTRRGDELIILLCGGDKASQRRDIARAEQLAAEFEA